MPSTTLSRPKPRSRSRSSTELAVALACAALAAACSDDAPTCGSGVVDFSLGLEVTIGGETVRYDGFTSSVNNDCSVAGSGVISVTIQGQQVNGTSALSLCLPRPDLIVATEAALLTGNHVPPEATDRVQVFDVNATLAAGCTARLEVGAAPTGTATFPGYCGDGLDPAGYALRLGGDVPVSVVCPGGTTTMLAALGGTASVDAQ